MSKVVTFNPKAEEKLLKGVNILGDAVASTLGPKGRNVLIDTPYGPPTVTKDGVTVAKFIDLVDPVENLGAQIIKQAAKKCGDVAGDGTTTTTVIAQALINGAKELVDNRQASPIDIKKAFESFLQETLKDINTQAFQITSEEQIKHIATISSNNDEELGSLIADAFRSVGKDGIITVEDSKTNETFTKISDGVAIDRGFISNYFVTDSEKMLVNYDEPLFLITDKKVRSFKDVVKPMEIAARAERPLVIIADEIEGQAINVMIVNKVRANINSCAVKAPAFGTRRLEILQDLCILTGATLISEASAIPFDNITMEHLGSCRKCIISSNETSIIEPRGSKEKIEERALQIKEELKITTSDYDKLKLTERLAKLVAKVAVLHVGAPTESELIEKKHRIDDAIRATKAAVESGYIAGGGSALVRATASLVDDSPALEVFKGALCYPIELIASSVGVDPAEIIDTILKNAQDVNFGYNAKTESYGNLVEQGVIDPLLVVTQALINAVSAANMLILSEVTIHSTQPKYTPPDPNDFVPE